MNGELQLRGDMARARWPMRVLRLVLRGVLRLAFRVRVRGLANVPRERVIICSNHLLWIDPILILLFLPLEPRLYVLGRADEVFKTGFRRFVVQGVGLLVPLDYDSPVRAMRTMEDVLARGGSLLIFPEGAVAGSREGQLLPLQRGAAHLSIASGVPILPLGLSGTRELWLGKRLTIRIGKPLDPATYANGPRRARIDALTTNLARALRRLLPGDQQSARIKPLRKFLTELFGPVD